MLLPGVGKKDGRRRRKFRRLLMRVGVFRSTGRSGRAAKKRVTFLLTDPGPAEVNALGPEGKQESWGAPAKSEGLKRTSSSSKYRKANANHRCLCRQRASTGVPTAAEPKGREQKHVWIIDRSSCSRMKKKGMGPILEKS